jgi:hypothetical protein
MAVRLTTCGMTSPARWMRTRVADAQAQPGTVAAVERDIGTITLPTPIGFKPDRVSFRSG